MRVKGMFTVITVNLSDIQLPYTVPVHAYSTFLEASSNTMWRRSMASNNSSLE